MADETAPTIPLDGLIAIALSLPLTSLVIAAMLVAVGLAAARAVRRPGRIDWATEPPVARRHLPERLALGIGSLAVITLYVIEYVARGHLLNLADVVEWWQYATPVFAATLSLAVVAAMVATRGTTPPQQAVLSATRRTWTSFGPRAGLIGAAVSLGALLVTTLGAGAASSADERGRFIHLELRAPNTTIDPVRPWFYGWDFGVPVLICLAALVAVTWAALHWNAIRPFLRPGTVEWERSARNEIAAGVLGIAAAGSLLALGGAWRFIARGGSIQRLGIEGDGDYELTWRYAEFAIVAGWLAPAVEIAAFALLLIVALRVRRTPARAPQAESAAPAAVAEAAR